MNFIRFNAEGIREENGVAPVRAYYCMFCASWHVTSKVVAPLETRNEMLFKKINAIKPSRQKITSNIPVTEQSRQVYIDWLSNFVNDIAEDSRKLFFEGEITRLKQEIDAISSNQVNPDLHLLKQKRIHLECTYIIRKRLGYHSIVKHLQTDQADQLFWKRWAEQKGYLCA